MNHLWRTQSAYLGARRRQLVHLEIHLLPALEVVGRHAGQIEPCAAEQKIISRVRKGALGGLSRAGCGSLLASPATGRGRTRSGGCLRITPRARLPPGCGREEKRGGGLPLARNADQKDGTETYHLRFPAGTPQKGPSFSPSYTVVVYTNRHMRNWIILE